VRVDQRMRAAMLSGRTCWSAPAACSGWEKTVWKRASCGLGTVTGTPCRRSRREAPCVRVGSDRAVRAAFLGCRGAWARGGGAAGLAGRGVAGGKAGETGVGCGAVRWNAQSTPCEGLAEVPSRRRPAAAGLIGLALASIATAVPVRAQEAAGAAGAPGTDKAR